jgi:TPR repeat protein
LGVHMLLWLGRILGGRESIRDAMDHHARGDRVKAYAIARRLATTDDFARLVLSQWLLYVDDDPSVRPEGAHLLQQASLNGNVDATYQLASCYLDGIGVSEDAEKGLQLLVSLAESGDTRSQLDVLRTLDEDPRFENREELALRVAELAAQSGMPELLEALKQDLANRQSKTIEN